MPISKKVEVIQALAVPKTRKQLRQFIGMINFYRDMWQKRSDLLAPLTALTSKNVKFMCAEARFAGVDFEPSLLEAGEHLFKDR